MKYYPGKNSGLVIFAKSPERIPGELNQRTRWKQTVLKELSLFFYSNGLFVKLFEKKRKLIVTL